MSNLANPGSCSNQVNPNFEIGCSSIDESGSAGNPNDLVTCFSGVTGTPVEVNAIRFWLGESAPIPDSLHIRVWSGGNPAGPDSSDASAPDVTQQVDVGALVFGSDNTVTLASTVVISDNEFCVGVHSDAVDDGFRMKTDSGGDGSKSYSFFPSCRNLSSFIPNDQLAQVEGNNIYATEYCIEAMVTPTNNGSISNTDTLEIDFIEIPESSHGGAIDFSEYIEDPTKITSDCP